MTTPARSVLLFLVLAGALTGCEKAPSAGSGKAPAVATSGVPLPPQLFLASAPADVREIKAAKQGAKVGDTITLRGRIGGSEDPFVGGRAIFTMVDTGMPACADNPEDKCKTPWDYCCETTEDVAAALATVQLVGSDGAVLKTDVKGKQGLSPLARIVVVGKVAQADDKGVLVVNASGIFVEH